MREARTRPSQREIQQGFKCQISSRLDGLGHDVIERNTLVGIRLTKNRNV